MYQNNFRPVVRYECIKCGRMYDVLLPGCRCEIEIFSDDPQQAYVRYAKSFNSKSWKQTSDAAQELVGHIAHLRSRIDDVLLGMSTDADKSLAYIREHVKVLENMYAICKVLLSRKKK